MEEVVRYFNEARNILLKCQTTKNGGAKAEKYYGDAFQKMIQEGIGVQIKKKYRSR